MARTTAKWTFSPISKVAKIHLGGTPKRAVPEYWGGDIKWASAADIASCDSRYIRTTTENITALGVEKSAAKILDKNTAVITARGTVGAVCLLSEPMAFNQSCYGLVCNSETDPIFLYYALKARIEQIKAQTYGAVFDTITIQSFDNITVPTPPIVIQRKIAAILSAYDDFVENNTRRIKIFEEMAQSIYREWFVKFRFPGHETIRMVDSKLGKIPEGWEIYNLGQALASIESGSRPKGGIDPNECEVPSIGAENIIGLGKYDFSKEKYVSREFYLNIRRGIVRSKDVLLYKDGAQIGRKTLFQDGFPHQECCINEHVFILRTNSCISQNYLFFWLDQPGMTQNIRNLNANAAQPGINQESVRGLPLLILPETLLHLFDERIEPLLTLLFNLANKNVILNKIRDLLLPRLISGELDVSNLDIGINDNGGN